jgi:hypothetical protein
MIRAEHTFWLDSGSLALDFMNTLGPENAPEPPDAIRSPADLLAFLSAVGLDGPPVAMTPVGHPPSARPAGSGETWPTSSVRSARAAAGYRGISSTP